jgi:hypothetical protein
MDIALFESVDGIRTPQGIARGEKSEDGSNTEASTRLHPLSGLQTHAPRMRSALLAARAVRLDLTSALAWRLFQLGLAFVGWPQRGASVRHGRSEDIEQVSLVRR